MPKITPKSTAKERAAKAAKVTAVRVHRPTKPHENKVPKLLKKALKKAEKE